MVMSRERMGEVLDRSGLAIRWGGILGLLCHPIYYVVWTFVLPQPYDNLFLRLSAALVCIPLIFQAQWPKRYNRYLLIYWHACLIYVLPFVCTYLTIRNGFSTMWMMTEVMMIFILALCIDSPLLLIACIGMGVATSSLAAVLSSPTPIVLTAATQADLALLPVVVLCSMAFSYAVNMGRVCFEKNRALQALAGSIVHEMRNPLSQLKHVLDSIEETLAATHEAHRATMISPEDAAALNRHLAQGKMSIERGLRVIAMMLDEVGTRAIRPERFAYLGAAAVTRKAIDEYGFADDAERNKVRLIVREDFTFRVDETVYLFTLFNLIKNALHHMAARPSATLTLMIERHAVSVRDTGAGVPPELLPHLFSPFRTTGASGNTAGTGLGLAYCRRAMQAFGGSIECRSEPEQFTEFTLRFPPVPEREVAEYEREILDRAMPVFAGKRILIVDDDDHHRTRTRRVLAGLGALVSEAANGQSALAMLGDSETAPSDLVLLDVNMPVLDGYAVAEKIRANHAHPNQGVPIAGYTVEEGSVAQVRARRAGMDVVIGKSGGAMGLIVALETLFASGKRRRVYGGFDGLLGKSILVADDDAFSRQVAKAVLERGGARVLEAGHGQAVLACLQSDMAIDAIVIDMNMPGMGGVEATARIRARGDRYAATPIIALTSQSDMEAVRECIAVGMNDVLVKPVQAATLYASLMTHLARVHAPAAGVAAHVSNDPQAADERDLLDERHLDELVGLDMLDQTFLDGIAQLRALVSEIANAARAQEIEATHAALHRLLGVSGNIGAKALHTYGRRLYPPMVEGRWPEEADWIECLAALGARSADALDAYFASVAALRPQLLR
ncbi:MAG TPA: response regulator [Paraburkholderia sp.]|uniref:ATP-binding response regulator n=1 Tax=Paraburkholderia sp. TaxID=1926495 RepID=UPI002DF4CE02|nr:response regulator [Paraburkholderia sp.]